MSMHTVAISIPQPHAMNLGTIHWRFQSVIVEDMLSDVGAENVSNLSRYNAITHSTSTLSNKLLRKKI